MCGSVRVTAVAQVAHLLNRCRQFVRLSRTRPRESQHTDGQPVHLAASLSYRGELVSVRDPPERLAIGHQPDLRPVATSGRSRPSCRRLPCGPKRPGRTVMHISCDLALGYHVRMSTTARPVRKSSKTAMNHRPVGIGEMKRHRPRDERCYLTNAS
jgi:hypothetical protein